MPGDYKQFQPAPPPDLTEQVRRALAEDIGTRDLSAAALDPQQAAQATITSHSAGLFCGRLWADETFTQVDQTIDVQWLVEDGEWIQPRQILCTLQGPAKKMLSAERTALNFLQLLSATATQTARFVQRVESIRPAVAAKIFDTRKTIPGLRSAQKFAVACGGGENHRQGLHDAILLKENYLMAYGNLQHAVHSLRKKFPEQRIEVEVEKLEEVKLAVAVQADTILLDNFSTEAMRAAVDYIDGRAEVEASGDIDLARVVEVAKTGVQRISVGRLTKDITALDLSLRFDKRDSP